MTRRFIPPAVEAFRAALNPEAADDLARLREGSFADGHANGVREGRLAGIREGEARAREEFQVELASLREKFAKQDAVTLVVDALEHLLAAREEADRAIEDVARAAIVAALRTLFPALLAHAAGEEVAAVVQDALVARAPDALTLRTHPDTLALVARHLPRSASERLTLTPDTALDPAAAIVTWTGGGLSFDPATLLERVVDVLSPNSPAAKDAAA